MRHERGRIMTAPWGMWLLIALILGPDLASGASRQETLTVGQYTDFVSLDPHAGISSGAACPCYRMSRAR